MKLSGIEALRSHVGLKTGIALGGLAILALSGFGIYHTMHIAAPQRAVVPQSASEPQPIPELRFQSAEAKPLTLSDFRGRAVLLNIWATWCVPCREEMPTLDHLQQILGGPDFQVIALSIDNGGPAAVRRFYDEIGIRDLAIYVDSSMETMAKLKTVGIPTTLLVDREGRELWRKTGPAEWDAPELVERLRRQIDVAPSAPH